MEFPKIEEFVGRDLSDLDTENFEHIKGLIVTINEKALQQHANNKLETLEWINEEIDKKTPLGKEFRKVSEFYREALIRDVLGLGGKESLSAPQAPNEGPLDIIIIVPEPRRPADDIRKKTDDTPPTPKPQ